MARCATIIGEIRDLAGSRWDVRESRQTSHGFSIYFGWPSGDRRSKPLRGKGFGGPRLIPTRELHAYWLNHQLDRNGAIYDLPIGRNTAKRVRQIFGFDYRVAHEKWWLRRLDDLCNLSGREFARKHSVAESDVSLVGKSFFGPRLRKKKWYLEPQIKDLLVSALPHSYVAQKLGITLSASRRLRSDLKRTTPAA